MAEKEYIERGALIAEIDENFHKTDPSGEEQIGFLKCRRMIREQPAADVVEVVRCKECTHYQPVASTCGNCYRTTCIQHTNDFCSYGERKSEI